MKSVTISSEHFSFTWSKTGMQPPKFPDLINLIHFAKAYVLLHLNNNLFEPKSILQTFFVLSVSLRATQTNEPKTEFFD